MKRESAISLRGDVAPAQITRAALSTQVCECCYARMAGGFVAIKKRLVPACKGCADAMFGVDDR